jgi:hypothetical protein
LRGFKNNHNLITLTKRKKSCSHHHHAVTANANKKESINANINFECIGKEYEKKTSDEVISDFFFSRRIVKSNEWIKVEFIRNYCHVNSVETSFLYIELIM